jgi:hypothetical protein
MNREGIPDGYGHQEGMISSPDGTVEPLMTMRGERCELPGIEEKGQGDNDS